jgi:hypothetical protein
MTIYPLALCLCLLSIITITIVPSCQADDIKVSEEEKKMKKAGRGTMYDTS